MFLLDLKRLQCLYIYINGAADSQHGDAGLQCMTTRRTTTAAAPVELTDHSEVSTTDIPKGGRGQ